MKKMSLFIIVFVYMMCPSGCSVQAADPEPVTVETPAPVVIPSSGMAPSEHLVVMQNAAQDERAQKLAEAEQEYQEEVAEIQREWSKEQDELHQDMAELEREWVAGEFDTREEYNAELQDYHADLAEAQFDMQETLTEARKALEKAKVRLSDGIIESSGSNSNFSLPKFDVYTTGFRISPRAERSAFFIPQQPMDSGIAEQISEDMQVMSTILVKAADVVPHSGSGISIGNISLFSGNSYGVTETIYIEDYGMIFKLVVDFPMLMIGGEDEPTHEVESIADEVWQKTMNELKGLDTPSTEKDKFPIIFDPEKVELLQEKLIKVFKHASNIRNMPSDARVVFVVSGQIDGKPGRVYEHAVETSGGTGVSVPTSVMTLQAVKKDIDAFAAGEMDLDTFSKRVSIVIY